MNFTSLATFSLALTGRNVFRGDVEEHVVEHGHLLIAQHAEVLNVALFPG